jgi:hypothetical protein
MASTISPLSARSGSLHVLGAQRPRILHLPDFDSTSGHEAVALARSAGLEPDPWQEFVTINALGERPDGQWAAGEVGVEVPRQNGKGGILEIRELAGLFLLGEMLLIHSAHEFATAEEALERMIGLLESNSELWKRVKPRGGIKRSHGQEGIYLKTGQRLRYRTRTKGGGRGWSADWVGLDEAMHIPEAMHGALMPTLSAMPNPQLWYTGSAVDQEIMEHGIVFARVRDRALRGEDPSLAYFGWSPDVESPGELSPEDAADPEVWAQANPGLGIRISAEWISKEHASMDPRTFAVERLGVGDWPRVDAVDAKGINKDTWAALCDPGSVPLDPVCFAFDVKPDRSKSAIGVAGRRADGKRHVEVVEHKAGTGWVVDRLLELVEKHAPVSVICDERGPAAALLAKAVKAGLDVETVNGSEYARACGTFFDSCDQDAIRHLGTPELASAVPGAATRPLGDAWAWSRKRSGVDISPLVAVTLALWGSVEAGDQVGGGFEW